MVDPTDAEIEAMAERLWDVWRASPVLDVEWRKPWLHLINEAEFRSRHFAAKFRAMARVALEGVG